MRVDVVEARCGFARRASARAGEPWRHGSGVIRFVMRPTSGIASLVILCALGTGCGAGPELRFADEEDASGADASGDASGGVDAGGAGDAARPDTAPAPDTGVLDTGSPALACPLSPPPPGVDACCGATACIDRENNHNCVQCGDCAQLGCQAGEVCCYSMSNGKLGCKKTAADCK